MKIDILLGLQWGDEGKGKIVDALSPDYDIIARFQGGPNAGHSIVFNNVKYILHLIPSGIFREGKLNLVGNGVVLDPAVFKQEVNSLGIPLEEIKKRVIISKRAHLILPGHRILDAASEHVKGSSKIGSTLKGIGPAYTDKAARNGIRVGDIVRKDFKELYKRVLEMHLRTAAGLGFEFNLSDYEEGWFEGVELLREFKLINSEYFLNEMIRNNKKILAEGAQGTMLDIDFGTYPYVTSSNTISAGAFTGLGVSPARAGEVFGIFKAYCTRVGSGPFPTELTDETGEEIRKRGVEFGATTGRPRRCGWLDLPALKYAIMINGVTRLFMTKADVLSGLGSVRVCTSYKINGEESEEVPFEYNVCKTEPVYREFPGWQEDISNIKKYDDLPETLKKYVEFIEKETGVPVTLISVGSDREQTVYKS
ncbi:MAG TPA: adenylosuccinate synthase [Bacteroidales bacterium]|nr:adenylosuccinate synthase [Bacteroidales bacterium]HOK75526.1 adenylosuccinate synthase [Bacteroidales bacterium]HOM41146.1 adenylosuccinate synthase [Bacteroidales bacterium]HPP93013.1 adenylosuccinate synthase [Bacteroidales bacterium]HRT47705.1 adenylosuccinate synthase [Bacteroidales bacterium]